MVISKDVRDFTEIDASKAWRVYGWGVSIAPGEPVYVYNAPDFTALVGKSVDGLWDCEARSWGEQVAYGIGRTFEDAVHAANRNMGKGDTMFDGMYEDERILMMAIELEKMCGPISRMAWAHRLERGAAESGTVKKTLERKAAKQLEEAKEALEDAFKALHKAEAAVHEIRALGGVSMASDGKAV